MNVPYTRAPHQGGPGLGGMDSPHAALLIDFDNVTMGMRSDLSRELKNLLDSDVIKGKVSVQRAYADWRRYPQYIVPLSEASVDLIFAPAYGSNKKNATDIRMAIDAVELVFIRPEIGTYILLTGDSDFSSLVLKLKEYGKYVIGVGIQESSSDILVQNCDEYYSYTSLTGLTKTTDLSHNARDPWVLVKDAVAKMVQRGDVMRSDRLKQVMQEVDPTFDEGSIGYSKFSKFLAEAASRGLVMLTKLENGQYEVRAGKGRGGRSRSDEGRGRRDRGRGGRSRRGRTEGEGTSPSSATAVAEEMTTEAESSDAGVADPLGASYSMLTEALRALHEAGRDPVRGSDVKRRLLEQNPGFDEAELGFSKFSLFLAQAAERGVIHLEQTENGNLDVSLPGESTAVESEAPSWVPEETHSAGSDLSEEGPGPVGIAVAEDAAASAADPAVRAGPVEEPVVIEVLPPETDRGGLGLGPRRGSTRRRLGESPPALLDGQAFGAASVPASSEASSDGVGSDEAGGIGSESAAVGSAGVEGLGLPSDPGAIVRYLTHRYKGVGDKTAETLVEHLGAKLFATMHEDPDAIGRIVPAGRAEQVLEAWRADYERRTGQKSSGAQAASGQASGDGRHGGRGRSRGRGRG